MGSRKKISSADGSAVKYGAGNVVLVSVPHVRVMRGETDEVVRRERDEAAEAEICRVMEGKVKAPDWYRTRWLGSGVGLVETFVFETEEWAARFVEAMSEYAKAVWAAKAEGKAVADVVCRVVGDDEGRAEEAAYFSAEWERAHGEMMGRFGTVLSEEAGGDAERRCVVGWVRLGGGESPRGAREFQAIGAELGERWPGGDAGDGIVYKAQATRDLERIVFAFGLPTERDAEAVAGEFSGRCHMEVLDCRRVADVGCDDLKVCVACVLAKMRESERQAKSEEV